MFMNNKKLIYGKLIKINGNNGVVFVEKLCQHPVYKKYFKKNNKFRVRIMSERKLCIGDVIAFYIGRPLSKNIFCYMV